MTNIIILGAGQGRRLSPLTDDKPKCLVSVQGQRIIEWQLRAIACCGLSDVTIVTGYAADQVDTAVALSGTQLRVKTLYNPFHSLADNIASCWVARDLFASDTVLINGDTLFDPRILTKVLQENACDIAVTIDRKGNYDADDMKVQTDGARLRRIGKTLTGQIDGESIGMLRFRRGGGALFRRALDRALRAPGWHKLWYLSVIDSLAGEGGAGVIDIAGLPWAEVDFPHDLPIAAARVASFDWRGGVGTGDRLQAGTGEA